MTNNTKIGVAIGVTSVVSLTVGVVSGYFLAKKRLEQSYADFASEEISQARRFYAAVHQKKYATPAEAVEALIADESDMAVEALKAYQGKVEDVHLPETEEEVGRNIFEEKPEPVSPEDWADEVSNRNERAPYVISKEEFFEDSPDYVQPTLTYYIGDNVLTDEHDQPITDVDEMVGVDNLRFGHMSGDPNIVYIRNNIRALDFEILRSEGKYSEEVAGFHHPKHSSG